jgi:dynein heavy chain
MVLVLGFDVAQELNTNRKSLLFFDEMLLSRLTDNAGALLEDKEMINVLASTKAKADEVKEKLVKADETRRSINEKRDQYRPVATRGSCLYFAIIDLSGVNCMYQTSLAQVGSPIVRVCGCVHVDNPLLSLLVTSSCVVRPRTPSPSQFTTLFMNAIELAERSANPGKRVAKIVETLTQITCRYISMGLYERDKLLFVLLVAMKVLGTAGSLDAGDVQLFLRGYSVSPESAVAVTTRRRPAWLPEEAWRAAMMLTDRPFFRPLIDHITQHEVDWRMWFEAADPSVAEVRVLLMGWAVIGVDQIIPCVRTIVCVDSILPCV